MNRVDGLAVYGRDGARGGCRLVFVHGSMDRGAAFLKAIRQLPEHACVWYDRRGYGRSAGAGVCPSVEAQARDLLQVIGAIPSVVIGHSFGGVIALVAACSRPDAVLAVGAFEAPMPWVSWWPRTSAGGLAIRAAESDGAAGAAERFMRRMIGDDRWEELPEATRSQRRAEGVALVAELGYMRGSGPAFDATAVRVPVVAGFGSGTAPQHIAAAKALASSVEGASLFEIPGATHGAPHSHPKEFAAFARCAVTAAGWTSLQPPKR